MTSAVFGGAPAHGPSHDHGEDATSLVEALTNVGPLVVVAGATLTYVLGTVVERRRRGWPVVRTASFLAGSAVLAAALSPGFDRYADARFSGHAAQHLLLAMLAPLLLVLGAPVTLALRTLVHPVARRLGRALHSRTFRTLTRPVVALTLNSGGLVLLYLTPLYDLSTRSTAVHLLVHAHLFLAGALFAWVIAGPDPAPGRASVRTRLVVLGAAILVHASVSQLLYAGLLVQVHEPVVEMRAAGSLMYFGGDLVELLLALALLVTWRTAPARNVRGPGTVRSRGLRVSTGSTSDVERNQRGWSSTSEVELSRRVELRR